MCSSFSLHRWPTHVFVSRVNTSAKEEEMRVGFVKTMFVIILYNWGFHHRVPLSRYWIYKLLEREEFPFLCPFKYMSVCCSTESVHLLTFCWCLSLFCVCVSCVSLSQTLGFFFRYLGKNIDYWLVHFWILTASYLIFSHFILTHLPASQVAGAIDPLWLS